MEQSLLSLVRSCIKQGYLPEYWHESKHDIIKTCSGYLALSQDSVSIGDQWYHKDVNSEDIVYDEINEQYILEENSIRVYHGRDDYFYTDRHNEDDYFEYNGRLYSHDGLQANELVFTVDNDVAHRDQVYYWESDDRYHHDPEDEDEDDIWAYHEGPCPPDYRNSVNEPGIGFEIEKGKDPVFCGYHDKHELFAQTGCVMEADSSVDWELKTPVYPLFSNEIESLWLPKIASAINAFDHDDAGGHIHLSLPPKNGKQLFDYCRPYFPLFMAMYPKRLEADYCKGKTESRLKTDDDKHQAIKIWENRIELRFPSKVYDMKAIVFRLNFCRLMVERTYSNIQAVTLAAFDKTTYLGKLIAQVYEGKELMLLTRILEVTKKYFNTMLLNEKSIETLLINLKTKKSCVLQS